MKRCAETVRRKFAVIGTYRNWLVMERHPNSNIFFPPLVATAVGCWLTGVRPPPHGRRGDGNQSVKMKWWFSWVWLLVTVTHHFGPGKRQSVACTGAIKCYAANSINCRDWSRHECRVCILLGLMNLYFFVCLSRYFVEVINFIPFTIVLLGGRALNCCDKLHAI